jgi:hypothetical protein
MAYFDEATKTMASFNREIEHGSHVAESAGAQFARLSDAIFSVGTATKLGLVKLAWDAITKYSSQIATVSARQLLQQKQQYANSLSEVEALREKLVALNLSGAASREELEITQQMLALSASALEHEAKRVGVATVFYNTIGESIRSSKELLTISGLGISALSVAINQNRVLNQSLIQANSAFKERYALVKDIFNVQTQTGASSEDLAEAARALVDYGLEQRDSFKENLSLVAMLKDGLGVSASYGAELVVTFERGLKQSAKGVADVITTIAAQTGLAAQKAAQYAVELARGLRLLGPMRTDAGGVAKAVESLAARVEELGGNSQSVVALYRQMLGGTSQSFMLRSLAGVSGPGSLASAAGAREALEGLGRSMQRLITAGPGTVMYAAQLELAAEMHGVAAEDVRNYLEALELSKKPLTELQTLERAYRQQTQLAGEAWRQLGNSLASLYKRGLTPLLSVLSPLVRLVADFVSWLANTKVAFYAAGTALTVGLGAAALAMINLTRAAWTFVRTSGVVSLLLGRSSIGTVVKSLPALFAIANAAPTLWQAFRGASTYLSAAAGGGRILGAGAALGTGALGLGAIGLASYGIFSIIERYLPDKPTWKQMLNPLQFLKEIARHAGDMSVSLKPSSYAKLQVPAFQRAEAAAAAIAELVKKGDTSADSVGRVMRKFGRGITGPTLDAFPAEVAMLMQKQLASEAYIDQLKKRTTFMLPEDRVATQNLEAAEKSAVANITSAELLKKIAADNSKRDDLAKQVTEARKELSEADYWFFMREGGRSNGPSYAPVSPRFGF